jgi:quinol-cytochrome oxidoreductase complex cytochrome b subunit
MREEIEKGERGMVETSTRKSEMIVYWNGALCLLYLVIEGERSGKREER